MSDSHRRDDVQSFGIRQIISGGQTGVDRGGLEAAIALGIAHGGWCPRGRLAEDGAIPSRYQLWEMESADYATRTEQNVIDSDATLILYLQKLGGGTRLTRNLARRWGKPHLCLRLDQPSGQQRELARQWLRETAPSVLNVAGPRGSQHPDLELLARDQLLEILTGA